jgi:hypothetical protein
VSVAGIRAAIARIGLPAWFLAIDLLWIVKPATLAVDARHYQRAADAWLAGGNPWGVTQAGVPFAAGPHTLLFYAPTSLLPLEAAVIAWMGLGIAASIWLTRRLGLPAWWLLFPPLAHSMWNGNPQTVALALLVAGGPIAASLAVGIKLYCGVPLLWRWRDAVVAGLVLLVTLPLVPWQLYLAEGLGVGSHLSSAWNGSALALPLLVPPTVIALWVLRRQGAEWFVVPALWPATQFYYVAMALPALVGRPRVAAALALPMVLMTPIVVMILAAIAFMETRGSRVPALRVDPTGRAGRWLRSRAP